MPQTGSWAELVFHVLAQVPDASRLPSSLYSRWYVDFAARHLGPMEARPLGEDVAGLGRALQRHEQLAEVQALAWLWRDVEQAQACLTLGLADLQASHVAEPGWLPVLQRAPWAAALRDAALLEAPLLGGLPNVSLDVAELEGELLRWQAWAPGLASLEIMPLRPLTVHGRLWDSRLWVGVPGCGAGLAQVACQAAHEATLAEVSQRAAALGEREREAAALVVLARRVAGTDREADHVAWCEAHGVEAQHLDAAQLSPQVRAIL